MYVDEDTRKVRQAAINRCRSVDLSGLARDLPMTKAPDSVYTALNELMAALADIPDADGKVTV